MRIKRYSRSEPLIFISFMVPYTVIINLMMLGGAVLSSAGMFFRCFGISLVYFGPAYLVFGAVAVMIRKRYSGDSELFRRIAAMLPIFYLMNLLLIQVAYLLYERNQWIGCAPERQMQWWLFGFACLASTILTFLNEATAGWEKWKASVTETSRLQNAYQKNRLLILKRQINPHFLFNCFNTLSSLIQENESEAENFLNELTRVYRYLLQGDEQQLVKLEEELKFIRSYLYLGKTRFGDALHVEMEVEEADLLLQMAPLTLQVILENIIYSNAFSKTNPLFIRIGGDGRRALVIANTEQPKKVSGISEHEEALDDLVRKYRLLSKTEIKIRETGSHREIIIPLIETESIMV